MVQETKFALELPKLLSGCRETSNEGRVVSTGVRQLG
jgi:hypothetical protein